MTIALGVIGLFVILVGALFVFGSYFAFWQVFKDFRARWRTLDRPARRRVIVINAILVVWIGAWAAALIISPWGDRTVLYLVGGMAVSLTVGIPLYIPFVARHQIHEADQRSRRSGTAADPERTKTQAS